MSKDDGGRFHAMDNSRTTNWGISRRDWLAGLAMQGFLSQPHLMELTKNELAIHAYEIADAMIAEGKK